MAKTMHNEFPTEFPTAEVILCINHYIAGQGELGEVAKASWLAVGWFLGTRFPVSGTTDPVIKAKGSSKVPSKAKLKEFVESLENGEVSAKALPPWLVTLLLELLRRLIGGGSA